MKMMKAILGRRKKHFGIDIGTNSVKLVEVNCQGKKPLLKTLISAPLQPDIHQDGNINNPQALSAVIRDLVNKAGISTAYCVSAINGQHVFNRFINFPVMIKAEVLEAIKWDAEKYIPYDPADCYMDVVILASGPGAREMKVLLVAAGREIIDTHVEILLKADLQPLAIDFGALALGRALPNLNTQRSSVILDMGAGSTQMTFYKGQEITFSRSIPFGGNRITHVLQEQLGLSWQEAENYKVGQKKLLVPQEGETGEVERMRNILRLTFNDMKREINRSLDYYHAKNQDEALTQMVFTGGCSLLPGLPEILLTDLDLQHVTVDLSEVIAYEPTFDKAFLQSVSPVFSTALGLALWKDSQ